MRVPGDVALEQRLLQQSQALAGLGGRRPAQQPAHVHLRAPQASRAQRQREVHAREQGVGVDPGIRLPGVAVGRLHAVQRHAHAVQGGHQGLSVAEVGARGAHRRDHELQRRLHLGAVGLRRPELGRAEQRAQHLADVAVALQEALRHAVHQRLRRIVGDEADGQLARDELRGVGIAGQQVQHLLAFLLAARLDGVPEHALGAGLVHALVELEVAAALWLRDGPPGEALGHLDHVLLAVAAVHAQGVQFHQLAGVVLVQPAALLPLRLALLPRLRCLGGRARRPRRALGIAEGPSQHAAVAAEAAPPAGAIAGEVGVGAHAQPVVQVEEHGRALGGGFQQLAELAQGARADDVALVAGDQVAVRALVEEDVEVVEPEVGHHFFQLALAVDVAQQPRLHQLRGHHLLRRHQRQHRLALLGGEVAHHLLPLLRVQRLGEGLPLLRRHLPDLLHALLGGHGQQLLRLEVGVHAGFLLLVRHGARAGLGALALAPLLPALLALAVGGHLHLVALPQLGVRGHGQAAFGDGPQHLRRGEVLHHLARAHAQGLEALQAGLEGAVIDLFGVELLLDPLLHTHLRHPLHLAGTGAETQPVERVGGALLLAHLRGFALLVRAQQQRGWQRQAQQRDQNDGSTTLQLHGCSPGGSAPLLEVPTPAGTKVALRGPARS